MPKVGIVMGSDSDLKVMSKAADMLDKLGIEYDMTIISAHREPDVFFKYAGSAEEKGYKVIIAGAGMAAHLPGMCAAIFPLPVIGVPMSGKNLDGQDALFYRADATWNPSCDGSDRRRHERSNPGSQNAGCI